VRALITFDTVREVALTLPDVVESTMYGSPALKVRGNLLACVPANKSVEPNCAVFRIDRDLRVALVKTKPEIYYITDHYADHPTVLARLSRMGPKELRDILGLAWSFACSKKPARGAVPNAKHIGRGSQSSRRERQVSGRPRGYRP
jgi:hypothetical protein